MRKPLRWGLRILSLLLCLMCLLTLARPAAVAEAEQSNQTMTTVVRNGGYYDAAVIGQMIDGTEITVLDQTGSFYVVDCYDMKGYIAKSQIAYTDDKYYVDCQAGSSETCTMGYTEHSEALALRHSLLALAREQLGEPYIYGSTGPYGFDCSGLTSYLYSNHSISLHRTASTQLQDGVVVAKEGMQVGDLVFFRESWETYPASHVGIYVGNNQIIHAGDNGIEYADLDDYYCSRNYLCARRIVNTDAARLEEVPAARAASGVLSVNSVSGRTVR